MVKCSVLLYILKKSPIYPIVDEESNKNTLILYHKYFQITNAQNIVFKPFVECFNTSKLPLKCYI